MVRAPDLKFGGPRLPGSSPASAALVNSQFASCQLGFLTCYVRFDYYLFPVISEWNACKLALGS